MSDGFSLTNDGFEFYEIETNETPAVFVAFCVIYVGLILVVSLPCWRGEQKQQPTR